MTEGILPLELDGIVFERNGQRLLDGLGVRFEGGGRSLILGPNGAGKSLMLRIAHGLLAPSAGRVVWHGSAPRGRAHQGMVFERPVLLRRSARANVEYGLAVQGVARTERRERAAAALARTGLSSLAERPARVLSGGEQQRLALARVWALEPEVIFLDEPTAALDPSATRAIEGLIADIAEAGTKIIMTTHDLGQARRLANEVILLHRGRILERAAAADFFDAPRTEEARAFLHGELLW